MMRVILQADVQGQGKKGDLVNVSDGYARNYLFPRKLAAEATPSALAEYEGRVKARAAKLEQDKTRALELAQVLKGGSVAVSAKCGEGGRLFGSVTNTEVAEALNTQFKTGIDRHAVTLAEPIKQCGTYTVKVKLGHGVSAEVAVEVKPLG